ncbi:TerB family tellurite resistance protein [Clostridium folliculivorans]|uniref:Co-chaperone DjlA N-terminal domain-containing protein n=1 Tax=Clostridium folliculivorans TaxID=2886038 RepID=A0A9W5XZE0_9CLOT|nr:TerB family tellurite resistance protein [Clostridium folliculivorans]GKU23788.1 hypothetical protein CFOLD11_06140 [Clostridium folliculivorans]GKU29904.1 hypothetical protein CFB3_20110 [Clostridium folliculivorans]
MFLNELSKKESILFINLVKNLANVDKVFSEKEEQLISDYLEELSLNSSEVDSLPFDETLKALTSSTSRIQNIIYFELVGLALVDGLYSEEETAFLSKIANTFNINEGKQTSFLNFFKDVKALYEITVIDYESKISELKTRISELLV